MKESMPFKINFLLTSLVLLATVVLLFHTQNFSLALLLLSFFYCIFAVVRNYLINIKGLIKTMYMYFQLALALFVCLLSESFFAQTYLLILICEFTFSHSNKHATFFTLVSYIALAMGIIIYRDFPAFTTIIFVFPRVIEFFAIFGMSVFAKMTFEQKNQLTKAYQKLETASKELRRVAIWEERTRISREIHDSVGHSLTSAITGLQAASHALNNKSYALASEMVNRTAVSIRNSLDNIRHTVHVLHDNRSDIPFYMTLINFLDETKKSTKLDINYHIEQNLPELSPKLEIIIFRILQEGITNGIRHGKCSCFECFLSYQNRQIRLSLSNNGKPPPQPMVYGFGLRTIKEQISDIGGNLSIIKEKGAFSFKLEATLPYHSIKKGEACHD